MSSEAPHWHDECTRLTGVGPKVAASLTRCGVMTLTDLLTHFPSRYEDRTRTREINALKNGEYAVLDVVVKRHGKLSGNRKKQSWSCVVADESGECTCRFFYYSQSHQTKLAVGQRLKLVGEIQIRQGGVELVHPDYELLAPDESLPLDATLTPIYPTTAGLNQKTWRKCMAQALALLKQSPWQETLPPELLQVKGWPGINEALAFIHHPPADADQTMLRKRTHPAYRRFALAELLAFREQMHAMKAKSQELCSPRITPESELVNQVMSALPFALTGAQARVLDEINHDLNATQPMLRLVQGDVGAGKTVVALLCALSCIASGYQVAMMVPTEILAEQHYQSAFELLKDTGVRTALLKGKMKLADKHQLLDKIGNAEVDLVIGTHALFQKSVNFARLGLAIIDEQHKFGVAQRNALLKKSHNEIPHLLMMTATPIPRSLALSLYADYDHSAIDELPPGRQAIKTVVIPALKRAEVVERVKSLCDSGRQVYWVCPLIEESDQLAAEAATARFDELKKDLPAYKVGLVHGRLSNEEKDAVMQRFASGELQVLVATTVIEVGVNVPNATLMIIENAERMGLAQLHQLRGRVGRGDKQSFCVLMYQPPMKAYAKERLETLRASQDGFVIAEKDLKLRGPGEFLGRRQAGWAVFQFADLVRDQDLLELVKEQTAA